MGEAAIKDGSEAPIIDANVEAKTASVAAPEKRNFSQHLGILGISKEELGKNVLDLGSGEKEIFSREASKFGIKVVSVNPQLGLDEFVKMADIEIAQRHNLQYYPGRLAAESRKMARMDMEGLPSHQGRSVAALATHLPFKDNSFDSVVSVFAIATYLPKKLYGDAFSEIYRVLKSGGKAFIGPIDDDSQRLDFLKSVLNKNDNLSYSIAKTSPIDHYPHHDITRHYTTLTLTKK